MANLFICCNAAECRAERCMSASPHEIPAPVGPCIDVVPYTKGGVRVWDEPCDAEGRRIEAGKKP